MNLPDCLQTSGDSTLLHLKVQPRASANEVGPILPGFLKVKVTAPPVDSAANEAVLRLLADALNLRRGDVQLVRGNTSRTKVVLIRGLTPGAVAERLRIAGP